MKNRLYFSKSVKILINFYPGLHGPQSLGSLTQYSGCQRLYSLHAMHWSSQQPCSKLQYVIVSSLVQSELFVHCQFFLFTQKVLTRSSNALSSARSSALLEFFINNMQQSLLVKCVRIQILGVTHRLLQAWTFCRHQIII